MSDLSLSPTRLALGTGAFVFASFLVQALSHFVLAAEHFAAIPFMRPEPIMALGVGTMLPQGLVLTAAFSRFGRAETLRRDALLFAGTLFVLLGGYIAVVEPSKYLAPDILSWVLVEGTASATQFTLFGLLLSRVFHDASR